MCTATGSGRQRSTCYCRCSAHWPRCCRCCRRYLHSLTHLASLTRYPNDYWRLINAVRDCGLDPGLILPNRTHTCIYGPKVGFMHHWDSWYVRGRCCCCCCYYARMLLRLLLLGQAPRYYYAPPATATTTTTATTHSLTSPPRYKWGESVMGVNLGAEGVMYVLRVVRACSP